MKYKYGKYYFDQESQEKKYVPRIYTDFYCSLKEWHNLGTGKKNFMYQLRSHIVEQGLMNDKQHSPGYITQDRRRIYDIDEIENIIYKDNEIKKLLSELNDDEKQTSLNIQLPFLNVSDLDVKKFIEENKLEKLEKPMFISSNGLKLYNLSFLRDGRGNDIEYDKYSAKIIYYVIKFITHQDADVEFFAHDGVVDHIEISFTKFNEMPNIIVLIDSYCSSTNNILINCINSIYKTLECKTSFYYERYHQRCYNNKWDKIFNCTEDEFLYNKQDYGFYDQYRLSSKRAYNKGYNLYYK